MRRENLLGWSMRVSFARDKSLLKKDQEDMGHKKQVSSQKKTTLIRLRRQYLRSVSSKSVSYAQQGIQGI